jgi:hypothetical protein
MDFFHQNSKQARVFKDLKKISILGCTTKTARTRRWTVDFITDKMALLLKLNEQVVKEKKAREIAMGKQGKAGPQKKLLWTIRTLVKRYGKSLLLHNEAQCCKENTCMKMPSLNYQNSGEHLQDSVLFNLMLQDLTPCPVCFHLRTQRLESQVAKNQAARAAAFATKGDGAFNGLSAKHGCFCHGIHCHRQQTRGNCPECTVKV